MNSSDDSILTDLQIIGQVKEHGRLCVRSGTFNLEQHGDDYNGYKKLFCKSKNILSRWYYQDNRSNTFLHVQNVVLQAFHRTQKIMAQTKLSNDDVWMLKCYAQRLESSIEGLRNLRITYESDASYCSKLDLIIDHITQHLISIKSV